MPNPVSLALPIKNIMTFISVAKNGVGVYEYIQKKRLDHFYDVLAKSIEDNEIDDKLSRKLISIEFNEKMQDKIYKEARRALLAESSLVIGTIALVTAYLLADEEHSFIHIKHLRMFQSMSDEEIIFLEKAVSASEYLRKTLQSDERKLSQREQEDRFRNIGINGPMWNQLNILGTTAEQMKVYCISLKTFGVLDQMSKNGSLFSLGIDNGRLNDDSFALIEYFRKAQLIESRIES